MLRRLSALVQKEFIQLARDRRTVILLFVAAALELLLFAAVVHTDVTHIPMVVADQSMSAASRSYLGAFVDSEAFDIVAAVPDEAGVVRAIDSGQATVGLVIPPTFARQVDRRAATVLLLVDGSSAFTSQSAYRAASAISQQYAVSLTSRRAGPLAVHLQILYNPDVHDVWFIAPTFIALIFQAAATNLTSLAIARERERGTIEALLVTPVRPLELMLGKTIPNLVVVTAMAVELWAVATLVLGVPFRGDPALFFVLALIAAGCGLSLGLVISTAVRTQNQAQQFGVMVNLATTFVGGVLFPTYALPWALRALGYLFPSTYFVPIARSMFLKGVGLDALWPQALALVVLLGVSLVVASRLFRRTLD